MLILSKNVKAKAVNPKTVLEPTVPAKLRTNSCKQTKQSLISSAYSKTTLQTGFYDQ